MEPGEFAVRGGVIDLFQPAIQPYRLDLFSDEVESIREFDLPTSVRAGRSRRFGCCRASSR